LRCGLNPAAKPRFFKRQYFMDSKLKSWLKACVVVCAVALTGCAATVQKGPGEQKMTVPAASARAVVFTVDATPEVTASPNWAALVEEWQNSMKWAADNAKISYSWAAAGSKPAAQAAVHVVVKVKDFKFVSAGKRWALGVFTGNASINAEASFTDLASGRALGTRSYGSSSSFIQGVFAPMTERQLESISTEIVGDVTKP
jgi:hypothetical protein